MSENEPASDVAALTVQLLSAYLANNTVASEDLAGLIKSTRSALTEEAQAVAAQAEPEAFTPAVSVRKSLASPEHIISLIDGKPYKTLKRHLASRGLTPDEYRSRYNLPASYPMVAPAYGAHRRELAQKTGLGSRKPAAAADDNQAAALVDEALDRKLPDIAPTSGTEEGQPKSARKAQSRGAGNGALASSSQANKPIVAPDNVPDQVTGVGDGSSDAPPSKRTDLSRQKKNSAAKSSPKATRQTKAKSATKAEAAPITDLSAPEREASGAAEPSSEPVKSSRTKRMTRAPKPRDGEAGEQLSVDPQGTSED